MAKKRISRYIERRRVRRRIDFDDSLINKRIGLHRSFCSIQATISRMTLEENKYQSLIIKKKSSSEKIIFYVKEIIYRFILLLLI